MKQEGTDKVVTAIQAVLSGEVYVSDPMGKTGGLSVERLSDRELEVFRLIGQGYGTRQIAETLHVSVKMVETYRQHIKEKLHLETATELLQHAPCKITLFPSWFIICYSD